MKKELGLFLAIIGGIIIIRAVFVFSGGTGIGLLFLGVGLIILGAVIRHFSTSNEDTSTTNSEIDENNDAMQEQDNEIEAINELIIGGIKIETEDAKPIDTIYEILINEGFRPIIHSTGNYIEFKIEGYEIRIQFHEDDENFIQLGSWVYDYEQEDKNAALDTANRVNIRVKYAFIALYSNQIIAHSDIFIDNSMDNKTVLFKHIYAVLYARNEFYRITNELKLSLN